MRPIWRLFLLCAIVPLAPVAGTSWAAEIPASKLRQLAERLHDPGGTKREIPASMVTLQVDDMPIWEALAEIEQQTGNKATEQEREFGGQNAAATPRVSCDLKQQPYWRAVDELLDAAMLDVDTQSGGDALAIVPRPRGNSARLGSAAYDGPFRIEAIDVQSQRNLRRKSDSSLLVQLQVAWEPRLRPIVVSQRMADLEVNVGDIASLTPQQPEAAFNAEAPFGAQAVELVLPFELPPRSAPQISLLRGKMHALVPGRHATLKFDNLAQAAGKSQRAGDVEVIVDRVQKNNEIWELHMRLKLDERNHALQSHRGWAFDNRSYLVDAKGEVIENVGLETVSEADQEIGVAYFFDLPNGVEGLTWAYETPVDMAETEIQFELRNIELP